jgi:hypothetical protein
VGKNRYDWKVFTIEILKGKYAKELVVSSHVNGELESFNECVEVGAECFYMYIFM